MKYISICTGVGGLGLPLKEKGFECVASFEIDKYCNQTYRANFPNDEAVMFGDFTAVEPELIPNHDVLLASIPCQSYSIAGKRLGLEDLRGQLIYNMFDILRVKKPKAFIFENVTGLLTIDKGETFKMFIDTFESLGYTVSHEVLNSKDFGVPQNRKRVFVVGVLGNRKFNFPVPPKTPVKLIDILEQNVEEKYFLSDHMVQYHMKRKEENKAKGKGFGATFVNPETDISNTITARIGKDGAECLIKVGHFNSGGQGDRVYSTEGLSVTLSALGGGRGACCGLYEVNQGRVRKLTPRECFRLQGYEDSFVLPCSNSQTYKMAGNGVTIPVVRAIVNNLMEVLCLTKETR